MRRFRYFSFLSVLPFVFCVCSCQLLSGYDNSTDSNEASDKTNDEQKVSNPDSIFFDSKIIYVDIDVETTVKFNTLPKKFDTTGFIMSTNHPDILEMVDQEKFLVKGKRRGETTLTISSSDGSVSGSCNVKVGYEDLQDITTSIETLEYEVGNLLQKKITIKTTPTYAKENIKVRLTTDKRANIAKVERDETSGSITFVVDMTKQYGKGKLLFYDDKDDNNVVSRSEIQKSVPIYAHKYDTKPIITKATCTTDGEEKYNCLCGCGKVRTVKIPALNHDFSKEFEYRKKPTCVEGGIEVHKCKHANCNEEHIVEVPPNGHTPDLNNKNTSFANLKHFANGFEKTKYYYKCSTCSQLAKDSEPFEVGNGDFLLKAIKAYDGTNFETHKKNLISMAKQARNNYEKETIGDLKMTVSTRISNPSVISLMYLQHLYFGMNEYLWPYKETGGTYNTTNNKLTGIILTRINNSSNIQYSNRVSTMKSFYDNIPNLTSVSSSDNVLTKIKKIYKFVSKHITNYDLDQENNLLNAFSKTGRCGAFSNLFKFVCNYYNIDCCVITGNTQGGGHAWNAVSYNNGIYICDTTYAGTGNDLPKYFMRGADSNVFANHRPGSSFNINNYLAKTSISYT